MMPTIFRLAPFILSGSSICIYGHGMFTYVSEREEDIIIAKKYTYVKNGSTNFMVIDAKGRHFNINNSFWHRKLDVIEDWTNIKPLEQCRINYYSFRVPFLGMFPTIVSIGPVSKREVNVIKPNILNHLHL